jgi:hypothetical protein
VGATAATEDSEVRELGAQVAIAGCEVDGISGIELVEFGVALG